jgi:hypothetical protein
MFLRNRRRIARPAARPVVYPVAYAVAYLAICLSIAAAALAAGCGQKGDLYLAEDDPERAERDARGKAAPFPLPAEDAEWPPSAPAAGSPAAADPLGD